MILLGTPDGARVILAGLKSHADAVISYPESGTNVIWAQQDEGIAIVSSERGPPISDFPRAPGRMTLRIVSGGSHGLRGHTVSTIHGQQPHRPPLYDGF